jgi:broad specificity phosphatase PhoE
MGQLYLVRHGQASLGAADYDQLSALGAQQSQRLGEHWRAQGLHFDTVITGTLRRHAQTLEGIQQGLKDARPALLWPGLNEYDSEAVIRSVHAGELVKPTTPEGYKQHFRQLRTGLMQWMQGDVTPEGMPAFADFQAGVVSALTHVRENCEGNVLLVSSGGPISVAVAHVLGLDAANTIELNLRIRNSAVSEFHFNAKRHHLLSFNTLAHLETPAHQAWVTYA